MRPVARSLARLDSFGSPLASKREMTMRQRMQMTWYYMQGYTMAVFGQDGDLIPGYSDWVLEKVLDELERPAAPTRAGRSAQSRSGAAGN